MTNWVRGALKIRGTKDNIKNFLLENLKGENIEIYEDDNKLTIRSNHGFHIDGIDRGYINGDIEFYIATEEMIKECEIDCFNSANYIDPEPYATMSRKYDIDIVVGGIEVYGGFAQHIEIQKGKIVMDLVEEVNRDFRVIDEEEYIEKDISSNNENLSSDD